MGDNHSMDGETDEDRLARLFGEVERATPPELTDRPDEIAMARRALAPVKTSLEAAGFYAYGTLDDQHRWTLASDDEAGRIDVRIGADGFLIELWASSPGLYMDEENPFRRRALERLARMTLPRITEGRLESNQSAEWDEVDHGVAVRIRFEVPFTRAADIGDLVRERLPELDELLTFVETQVTS
ncbi:MAG TPA: hypothetical protein VFL82_10190 [Thermomicrobiales bacterium]|nr:hypothetical protein [Thermomicrobiales bacterium]